MDPTTALSLQGLIMTFLAFLGAFGALGIAKYAMWKKGMCVPGIIPCDL